MAVKSGAIGEGLCMGGGKMRDQRADRNPMLTTMCLGGLRPLKWRST